MSRTKQKSSPKVTAGVIRVAVLKNPKTKREVFERVTADGRLSKRAAKTLGIKKVSQWTEVEAASWRAATAAVRAGKGRKVRAGQERKGSVPFAKAA